MKRRHEGGLPDITIGHSQQQRRISAPSRSVNDHANYVAAAATTVATAQHHQSQQSSLGDFRNIQWGHNSASVPFTNTIGLSASSHNAYLHRANTIITFRAVVINLQFANINPPGFSVHGHGWTPAVLNLAASQYAYTAQYALSSSHFPSVQPDSVVFCDGLDSQRLLEAAYSKYPEILSYLMENFKLHS
eukprot:scaffold20550_cov58-Cyclotella_meneghiniana.AAC.3